jgi:hypothetical protein
MIYSQGASVDKIFYSITKMLSNGRPNADDAEPFS